MMTNTVKTYADVPVWIPVKGAELRGDLAIPDEKATGLVIFAHGSGSSRLSPRNQYVAGVLYNAGLATLLIDLLTPHEEEIDALTRHLRFDIRLLGDRLVEIIDWVAVNRQTEGLKIGLFGASTGAAAAIMAATRRPKWVNAVVSRGGRPDLAAGDLTSLECPTLLIVGGNDRQVIELNSEALSYMTCTKLLATIPGATHLFEESGTLSEVAQLAQRWFTQHLE